MIAHKYNWLYILQGWAILWVVIGNTYLVQAGNGPEWERALLRTAYSFHLPLLMFVSGCIFCKSFLLSDDNPQQKSELLKSHVLRLVVPFVLFTFIAIIAKAILSRGELSYGILVGDFIQGFMFPGEHPMSPLWFVMVLIWLYLMYPVWEFIIKKNWIICAVGVALLAIHLVNCPIELLCVKWLCYFALYFYLGIIIMKKGYLDHLSGMNGFYIFVVGYVLYMSGLDFDKTLTEVSGIVLSIGIALILNKTYPGIFFTFRSSYFQLFLLGYFVQLAFRMVYPYLPLPYFLGYLMCLAFGIYVPVVITKLVCAMNSSSLNCCLGLTDEAEQAVVCNNNKLAVEI